MSISEKRRESRLPLEVRVQLQRGDHIQTHLCSDISTGGLFVLTSEPWRNGEQIGVRIFLPGLKGPLNMRGEVLRSISGSNAGIAVRFLEASRDLQRFCQNRGGDVLQRAAKRILLAHAKEDLRFFLRSILAVEGYRIFECKTLAEVRTALTGEKFDLLVADPLLGGEAEEHLAEYLVRHPFDGPVVMITEGEVVGDAPFAGGDYALVSEPVELSSFRGLVWSLVK